MQIVEPDFILIPSNGLFNLVFYKKVKDKETGKIKLEQDIAAYGCTLASAINRIVKHRINTIYESENPCLLDALKTIIDQQKKIIDLCNESQLENLDTGG